MKMTFFKNLSVGIGIAIAFLLLIELVLLVVGITPVYQRSDPSVGFAGYAPLFQKHLRPDGTQIYQTANNKLQWFNVQSFPVKKAQGVTRVFCLGGSTTFGRPYDDRTSFCGWLRLFLPAIDSTRKWEVINAGGISYASYRVARLMEELTEYEPDLFVVYSGHNEFLESRTYSKLLKIPGFVRSAAVQASRTRLYSLLYDLFHTQDVILPTEVTALLDHSVGPEDYHRDDEMRASVVQDYENSLQRMTRIGKRVGAEMILVTPASNIRDFSPFKTEPAQQLTEAEIQWIDTLKNTITHELEADNPHRADSLTRIALAKDDRDAELLFLHAQALWDQGLVDEAHDAFRKSRDEDICPLRALTSMHHIVGEVAHNASTGFVDYVKIMNEKSPDGIPGSELFLDHVHPTIEGNRLLALTILREMKKMGIVERSASWNETTLAEIKQNLENSLDEETHAQALRKLSRVLTWAGKHDEAERLANRAIEMIPDDSETQAQKGLLLWRAGDRKGALVHYREAVSLNPWDASMRQSLGILLSELNRLPEALTQLEEAVRLDPKLPNLYYDRGVVLQALGQTDQAESAYRIALERDPENAHAYNNLGIISAQRGKLEVAAELFSKALQIDPENEDAEVNLNRARRALEQLSNK